MSDTDTEPEPELTYCGDPCRPSYPCDKCVDYWERMRSEGYWDSRGWTDKGMRLIIRNADGTTDRKRDELLWAE